eukprot:GHVH01010106.1.p2 GENE.GHVH01010106.1~~GHVH01010106.1.p2  ORF type:complete len:192 (-),score=45.99 GHVH01010106.1:2095-2670(-)
MVKSSDSDTIQACQRGPRPVLLSSMSDDCADSVEPTVTMFSLDLIPSSQSDEELYLSSLEEEFDSTSLDGTESSCPAMNYLLDQVAIENDIEYQSSFDAGLDPFTIKSDSLDLLERGASLWNGAVDNANRLASRGGGEDDQDDESCEIIHKGLFKKKRFQSLSIESDDARPVTHNSGKYRWHVVSFHYSDW